jgi:hypothetical protein
LSKDIEAMNKRVDEKTEKYGELSNDEINEIIHEHRQRKRRSKIPNKELRAQRKQSRSNKVKSIQRKLLQWQISFQRRAA